MSRPSSNGWHGDQSETFLIGEVSETARAVTQCAFDCLHAAIDAISPGCPVSVIGETIMAIAEEQRFSVVREYVGHGLGRRFHQEPSIPHYPTRQSRQDRLLPGLCFTDRADDQRRQTLHGIGQTGRLDCPHARRRAVGPVRTHVLMTEEGPEILTQTTRGPQKGHRF